MLLNWHPEGRVSVLFLHRTPIQTNLCDDGLVGKRHWESADGVLLEAVVEVAQRLVRLHLEAVIEQLGAARRLAVLVPHPEEGG